MPPPPSQNDGKGKNAGRASARPYADAYLVGLRIGLSCDELREIPYPAIMWLIHQYTAMSESAEERSKGKNQDARTATEADIRAVVM